MDHKRSGATCLHVLGTCSPGKSPPGAIPDRETLEQDTQGETFQLIWDEITHDGASELLVQSPPILKPPNTSIVPSVKSLWFQYGPNFTNSNCPQ